MSDVPKIVEIELLDDYMLIATFDNGIRKRLDFKPLLTLERFAELQDAQVWRNGKITPNGSAIVFSDDVDMAEFELWNKSTII